jgi:hypothetical protein
MCARVLLPDDTRAHPGYLLPTSFPLDEALFPQKNKTSQEFFSSVPNLRINARVGSPV